VLQNVKSLIQISAKIAAYLSLMASFAVTTFIVGIWNCGYEISTERVSDACSAIFVFICVHFKELKVDVSFCLP
jgi:hypothetical protein